MKWLSAANVIELPGFPSTVVLGLGDAAAAGARVSSATAVATITVARARARTRAGSRPTTTIPSYGHTVKMRI